MQSTERVYKAENVSAIERVVTLAKESKTIALSNLFKVRATQLMSLKKSFRDEMTAIVVKNNLTLIALKRVNLKNSEGLLKEITGQKTIIFTNMDPFKLQLIMEKGKIDLAARAGDLATSDISIPAGNTGIPPGPVLSEFKSVDVATRIETGSIFVARDTVVAKRGDEITLHLAGLLSRLNIKPLKAGLSVDSAYMGGLIFHADDISINLDSYRAEIISSFQSALALGVEQSYMTSETTPLIIAKAFRSARGLSVTSGFFTKETVDEIILLDHMKAVSLSNTIESKGYSAE